MFSDNKGEAFVEAAILFPIMIMIFAGLVLLSMYLPTRAALQRATQYAATAIATTAGDTWLSFDEENLTYIRLRHKASLTNVYADLFSGMGDISSLGESIVMEVEEKNLSAKSGVLTVYCKVVNNIIYREVIIVGQREFQMPVDLSFVGFPSTITITVSSTAVVNNGDEFIRNVDLAVSFYQYIEEKFGLSNVAEEIAGGGKKLLSLMG